MARKTKSKTKARGPVQVVEELNKRFGEETVFRLDSDYALPVEAVSTGSLDLDIALGVGGLPRGRVIEVFGDEGFGKTTLALSTMAQAQKYGDWVGFIDMEHAIDPKWVAKNGINIKKAYMTQPESGEEAIEIALALVRSGEFGVVCVDSVAALLPKAEEEGDIGDHHIALQARLMGQALRKMMPQVGRTNTMVIFTNQVRYKMNVRFGDPTVTPGGKALKFWSSVRIHMQSKQMAYVKKNKVAAPYKKGVFSIHDDYGSDSVASALKAGSNLGLIKQSGAYYSYGEVKGQGWEKFVEAVRSEHAAFEDLQDRIRSVLGWVDQPRVILDGEKIAAMQAAEIWDAQVDLGDVSERASLDDLGEFALPDTPEVAYKQNDWNSPEELVALMKDAGTFEVSGVWVRAFGESYQGWTNLIRAMQDSPQLYLKGEKAYLESTGLIQDTDKK